MRVLLLIGLLLRILVAPFTSHPYDVVGFAARCEWTYILHMNTLYYSHSGTLTNATLIAGYPLHIISSWLGFGNILTLQLAIKLPFILADVGIAFLLYQIVIAKTQNVRLGKLLAFIWLVNPSAFFFTGVHGAYDAMPVLFSLLAILFLVKDKPVYSLISLTVAFCLKYFAIFLFPLFILYFWRKSGKREWLLSTVGSLVVMLVNFFPFIFDSVLRSQLWQSVAYYSTGTVQLYTKPWSLWHYFNTAGILSHFPTLIQTHLFWISFTPLYILTMAIVFRNYVKWRLGDTQILKYAAIILLLLLPLNPGHDPQWILWALPLLFYLAAIKGDNNLLFMASALWLMSLVVIVCIHDTEPFRYLVNAYPAVMKYYYSDYYSRPYDYLATYFGLFYSAFILGTIFYLFRTKISSVRTNLLYWRTNQGLKLISQGSFFTCLIILTFVFTTIISLPSQPLPTYSAMRDYVLSHRIFNFDSAQVTSYTSETGVVKELEFKVDAIRYMTDRSWQVMQAYYRLEVDGKMYGKEIPIQREDLNENTIISVQLPSDFGTKEVKGTLYFRFDWDQVRTWWDSR